MGTKRTENNKEEEKASERDIVASASARVVCACVCSLEEKGKEKIVC